MKKLLASLTLATLVFSAVPVLASAHGNDGKEGFGARIGGFFHGWHFGKNPNNFVLTGTVVSISGVNVVVNADATVHIPNIVNGQVTVVTDGNTVIKDKHDNTLTVGQLVAGDRVSIEGTVSGSTLTAVKIHDAGPPPAKPATTSGKVTVVSATSLTLVNAISGTTQVFVLDANTKVMIDGVSKTVADIAIGDAGMVKSKANGSVFTATMLNLFR